MIKTKIYPVVTVVILLLIVPAYASAEPTPPESPPEPDETTDGQDCDNYGTQVIILSQYGCDANSDCGNYGIQIIIGSSVECAGDCQNNGVLVSGASNYCGDPSPQVCYGQVCIDSIQVILPADIAGATPEGQNETTEAVATIILHVTEAPLGAVSQDCVPRIEAYPRGTLTLSCDASGEPCGISQQPVCWTARYGCTNGLNAVLRVYDRVFSPSPTSNPDSRCEQQPGAPGG